MAVRNFMWIKELGVMVKSVSFLGVELQKLKLNWSGKELLAVCLVDCC